MIDMKHENKIMSFSLRLGGIPRNNKFEYAVLMFKAKSEV
jgi:hypothetical protein